MSTQISVADTALTYTLTLSVQDVLSPALKTATQVSNQALTVFDKLEKKSTALQKSMRVAAQSVHFLKDKLDVLNTRKDAMPEADTENLAAYNQEIGRAEETVRSLTDLINPFPTADSDKIGLYRHMLESIRDVLTHIGSISGDSFQGLNILQVQQTVVSINDLEQQLSQLDTYSAIDLEIGNAINNVRELTESINELNAVLEEADLEGKFSAFNDMQLDFPDKTEVFLRLAADLEELQEALEGATEKFEETEATLYDTESALQKVTEKWNLLKKAGNDVTTVFSPLTDTFATLAHVIDPSLCDAMDATVMLFDDWFSLLDNGIPLIHEFNQAMDEMDLAGKLAPLSDMQMEAPERSETFAQLTNDLENVQTALEEVITTSGETDLAIAGTESTLEKAMEMWDNFTQTGADVTSALSPLPEMLTHLTEIVDDPLSSALESAQTLLGDWLGLLDEGNPLVEGLTSALNIVTEAMNAYQLCMDMVNLASQAKVVWDGIMEGSTLAMTAAQWALNAAMTASPLTWIALAIGAVVAAVVVCWNKFEGFRNVMLSIWDAIKSVGKALLDFLLAPLQSVFSLVKKVTGAISSLFKKDKGSPSTGKMMPEKEYKDLPDDEDLMPDLPEGDFTQSWEMMNEMGAPQMVVQQNVHANFAPAATRTPGIPAKTEELLDLNPEDDSSQMTREYLAITSRLASMKVSLAGKPAEPSGQTAIGDTVPDALQDILPEEITPDIQELAPENDLRQQTETEKERMLADPLAEWTGKTSDRATITMDRIREKTTPILDNVQEGIGKAKDYASHPLGVLDSVRENLPEWVNEGLDWLGIPNGEEEAPQGILTPLINKGIEVVDSVNSFLNKGEEVLTPIAETGRETYSQARDFLNNPLEVLDGSREQVAEWLDTGMDWLGIPNGEEESPQGVLTPILNTVEQWADSGRSFLEKTEEKYAPTLETITEKYNQVKEIADHPDNAINNLAEKYVPESARPLLETLGLTTAKGEEEAHGPLSFLNRIFKKGAGVASSVIGKTENKVKPVWESSKEKYDQAKEILEDPFAILEEGRVRIHDIASEGMDRLGIPYEEGETPDGWLTPAFRSIHHIADTVSDFLDKTEEKYTPILEGGKGTYTEIRDVLNHPLETLEVRRDIVPDAAGAGLDKLGIPNGEETREGWLTPLFNLIEEAGEWVFDLLESGEERMTSILDIIGGAYDQARDVLEDPFGSLREWTAQAPAWIDQILDAVGIPEGNPPTEIAEPGLPEEITGTPESIEMGTIQAETQQTEEPAHIRSLGREPWSPLRTLAAAATLPFMLSQPVAAMEELSTADEDMYAVEQTEGLSKDTTEAWEQGDTATGTGRSVYIDRVCDQIVINVTNTDGAGAETIRYEIMKVLNEICEYEG
ncbi:MAG: hypothetical protein LIP08_03250 [Bacteroides sp.]|nr:hypothetical protein [Bacteroides sp.]